MVLTTVTRQLLSTVVYINDKDIIDFIKTVESDITVDTNWDLADSPIRINPSNDYLSISANLQIEPGVVIQVASGKGISFDGACDTFTANGNVTDHILFEGQAGSTWAGLAFTDSCSSGTDDRHQFLIC